MRLVVGSANAVLWEAYCYRWTYEGNDGSLLVDFTKVKARRAIGVLGVIRRWGRGGGVSVAPSPSPGYVSKSSNQRL